MVMSEPSSGIVSDGAGSEGSGSGSGAASCAGGHVEVGIGAAAPRQRGSQILTLEPIDMASPFDEAKLPCSSRSSAAACSSRCASHCSGLRAGQPQRSQMVWHASSQ